MEILCATILIVLERQCADQLPGGKYYAPSEDMMQQASEVPTSNIISERDFALFDVLLKSKPAVTTVSLEALIMWTSNKLAGWLFSLPENECSKYQEQSRKMVEKIRNRAKSTEKKFWSKEGKGSKKRNEGSKKI